jgi:hypothetical protein
MLQSPDQAFVNNCRCILGRFSLISFILFLSHMCYSYLRLWAAMWHLVVLARLLLVLEQAGLLRREALRYLPDSQVRSERIGLPG